MKKTRAIRLSDNEEQLISEFLRNNSFLDFSSLARLAIIGFIKNPKIIVQPISETTDTPKKRGLHNDKRDN